MQGEQLADLKSELARLEKELTVHQAFVKRFEEEETKLRNHLKELKGSLLEIEGLEREIALLDAIQPMDKQIRELQMEMNRPPRVQRVTLVSGETVEPRIPEEDLILQDMANAIMPTEPDPNPRLLKTVDFAFVVGIAILLLLIIRRRFCLSGPSQKDTPA